MTEAVGIVDLAPLDRAECLRLLRQEVVGRVIFTDAAMPTALPVTYAVNEGEIVFRVRVGGTLAHAVHNAVVAFEADALDPVTLTGWSVVGVGQTHEVTDPARLDGLTDARLVPWAPTGPAVTVAIRLQQLTGSRLSPARGVADLNPPT